MAKKDVENQETDSFLKGLHKEMDIKREWKYQGSVSTGILALDLVTSKGGMPRGLLIDLYGDEGLGKTTMSLTMAAERIRCGERCAFLDVEHRVREFDEQELIDTIIPDKSKFELFEPKTAEAAFETIERLLRYPEFSMIILDSVASLVFAEEMEIGKYTQPVALLARKVGAFSKKILTPIYQYGAMVVFINQLRTAGMGGYGGTFKTSTGGKAIRFYSSLRLKMAADQLIKKGDRVIGQQVKLKIDKNSFGAPFRETSATIMFGQGIDRVRDLVDCGTEIGVIVQSGPHYKMTIGEGKKAQEIQGHGEAAFIEKLAPHLEVLRDMVGKEIAVRYKKDVVQAEVEAKTETKES